MSDKMLIVYNTVDTSFPVCGFLSEIERKKLLEYFTNKKEKYHSRKTFSHQITGDHEEDFLHITRKEIIKALSNPIPVPDEKPFIDLITYDLAAAIYEDLKCEEAEEDEAESKEA